MGIFEVFEPQVFEEVTPFCGCSWLPTPLPDGTKFDGKGGVH